MLNQQAANREYLMEILNRLQTTTSNSLKLQSTALAQLTSSTNELTRKTLVRFSPRFKNLTLISLLTKELASQRCLQLSKALRRMSKRISFEDLQFITQQLSQCSTNLLTVGFPIPFSSCSFLIFFSLLGNQWAITRTNDCSSIRF